MLDRERADAEERGAHRGGRRLGEPHELALGVAQEHTVARKDHGALGAGQRTRGVPGPCQVDVAVQLVARDLQVVGGHALGLRLLDVLADVDQHRSRPAGGGDVKGLVDDPRQLVDARHQVAVLGHGAGRADHIRLLEGVPSDLGAYHLARDRDHRHRVHVRGAQTGDEVQRTRARGGEHDARLAAGARVAVRHVRGALLVADQDVLELRMLGQVLVDRQVGAAGVAEDVLDTFALQRLEDHVGSGQVVAGSFLA